MLFDEAFRKETEELLANLVRIKSTNPPGDEDEIAFFAKSFLEDRNVSCQIVPLEKGRSSILARIEGREPGSVLLCGHFDTVRVKEGLWSVPPFEAKIIDDQLWGRGAADMKAGVAVIMKLASWVAGWSHKPKKTLMVALTADEENGFGGARSLVRENLLDDVEFLVITEPTQGRPYVGEKGALWLRVLFHGRAGHGSVPHLGASTVLPACRYVCKLMEFIAGLETVDGRGRTTINVGEFHGGRQINVIAASTELKIDIRLVSRDHRERILENSQQIAEKIAAETDTTFEQEIIRYQEPRAGDPAGEWIKSFLESAERVTGERIKAEIVPYATDGAVIAPALSISHVVCGPGSIAQAHQPDEYVKLTSLNDTAEIIAEFLRSALD